MGNFPAIVENVKLTETSGRAEVYSGEKYFLYGAIYEADYAR
jgi:hypothetical protein